MGKHKILLWEVLYNGPKELPRSIYVSDILETLLKFGIDDLKLFHEGMSDYEIKEWRRRDPKRLEVVSYLRDDLGLSKYVDAVDEAMTFTNQTRKTAKKNKK